jgi:hypothetical protein
LLIADGMTQFNSCAGSNERNLLKARSNSSVNDDFLGLLVGTDRRE